MKKLLVILLFLASSAHGEIYTWKESGGTAHYTNDQHEIPERYRARAKVLNLGIIEKKDNYSPQQNTPPQQNAAEPQREQHVQPIIPAQSPAILKSSGNPVKKHAAMKRRRAISPEE
jgi:hypothetical protein